MKGLARRTRQGLSWTLVGSVATNLLQIATLAILARVLVKRDFGLVAAAMLIVQFGNTIRDLGLGQALVQRKDVDREHVESAFTFSVLFGVVLAAVVVVLAGPIARFFNVADGVEIVRLYGGLFLLRGLAVVPTFMCRREMRFRALTIIDLIAYATGAVVSVALALFGSGVWALVWGDVIETAISVVLVIVVCRPPKLRMHVRQLKELLGFGVGRSAAVLANYFANQGDYMVVGHYLDATQLGVYQRAYELIRFPASVFTSVAGSVLFSAFAKIQHDPERLGRNFRRANFICALVLLPASVGAIVLAPELIRVLMGPNWSEMIWPFRIMAMAMLFRTTHKLGGIIGRSTGEVFTIAGWQVVYAVCVIGGALISVRWGVLGVSCTTSIAIFVSYLTMSSVGLRATPLRWRDLALAHLAPALIAAAVGVAAWGVAELLRAQAFHPAVVLGVATAAGIAVFAVLVLVASRRTSGDWVWVADNVKQMIRPRARQKATPAVDEAGSTEESQ